MSGITPVPEAAEPLLQHALAYRCVPAAEAIGHLTDSCCCNKKRDILLKCSSLESDCDCFDIFQTHTLLLSFTERAQSSQKRQFVSTQLLHIIARS